jgi:hypothetical protein
MKRLLFVFAVVFFAFQAKASNEISVSGAISGNGSYDNLRSAFAAINGASQTGANIVITITASPAADNATAVLYDKSWASLTIYPTATATISGTVDGPLIDLDGADNVTIEGRLNSSGTPKSLTISNASTGTAASTIRFINDAKTNKVQYCTIKGSSLNTTGGVIFFSTATTDGNDGNTISYNDITNESNNRPLNVVYSGGTDLMTNSSIAISNNNFFDFFNTGAASATYGVNIATFSDAISITNNSFYETSSVTATTSQNCVVIGTYSGSYSITGNYIGSNQALCAGTALTKTGSNNNFKAIEINGSSVTTGNVVQGNTIKSISWTNNGTAGWHAISMGTNSGNGTVSENIIGSDTGTGSISITTSTGTATYSGIYFGGSGSFTIQGNKIGSMTSSGGTNQVTNLYGIFKNNVSGSLTISKNSIGSATTANSMNATTSNSNGITAAAQNSFGIYIKATGGDDKVEENTIAGINNASSANNSAGIYTDGSGTSNTTVRKNFISGITNTGGYRSVGIRVNTAVTTSVENNIVSLSTSSTSVTYGVYHAAGTTVSYYYNTVYIGGSGGSYESAAFFNASATSTNCNNNNLINKRTGSGNHYAYKASATGLQSNYNNYYVSGGTGNANLAYYSSANRVDIAALRTANSKDAQSISLDPGFPTISSPTVPNDYRGSAAGLVAGNTISVTADYEGITRAATPTIGAFEYASIWNGSAWTVTPTATYNAVVNGIYSGAGFNCKDLIVNPGKQVTVTSSTLSVAGNLLLKSDATNGTATFIDNGGTLSVTGTSSVQQYLTSGRNWYISSPVSDATSNVVSASVSKPIYYYVEASPNTWSSITNTTTSLGVMSGYIVNVANTGVVTFTGGTLNTGTVAAKSISGLTRQEVSFKGFNLIGNPYPSYVNWDNANITNVGTSIWYRSKNTGLYVFQTYNRNGGLGTNGGTQYIPPMQAFWVQVSSGTGTVEFPNSARSHQDQSVSTNRLKAPAVNNQKVLRLQVANEQASDEAVIYYDSNAADNLDSYDTQKMSNGSVEVPEIFTSIDGTNLAINGLRSFSSNSEFKLGFKTGQANSFNIKVAEILNFDSGMKVILKDNYLNTESDLTDGTPYTFDSGVSNSTDRFSLVFRSPGTSTGIDNAAKLNGNVFVNAANQITIIAPEKSNYAIFNSIGQIIEIGQTKTKPQITNCKLQTGIYVVKVGSQSTRVVLK